MSAEAETTAGGVSTAAKVAVLEEELETVRWMASKAASDELKAAAGLRVLELNRELEALRAA